MIRYAVSTARQPRFLRRKNPGIRYPSKIAKGMISVGGRGIMGVRNKTAASPRL
jgi:hypothetical protein